MNNYYKLDDQLKQKIENISDLTCVDYDIYGDFIQIEALFSIIQDLYCEYQHLEEEFEDFKQDVQDNYKRISVKEQVM